MKSIFIVIMISFLSGVCFAQRTTRKNLKLKEEYSATIKGDTIKNPDSDILKISGYDKPLSSHYETFFVTNNGNKTITAINLTLNYFNRNGRQLHSITKTIDHTIPPGETRQLSLSSWDKQNAFYYYRSPQPRRQATPYSVTHSINFAIIPK